MNNLSLAQFQKMACLLFLCAFPFFFNRLNAESPFELFKMTMAGFCLIPIFIISVFSLVEDDTIVIKWNNGLVITSCIFLSTSVSFIFSVNPYLSFWGDNLLPSDSFRSVVLFTSFTLIVSQLFDSVHLIKKVVYALIFLAAVLVTYGVLQINQLDPLWFSVNKLVYATIGNQGAYANVLGALAPFVLGLFFTTKKTHIKFFSVVLYFLINICLVYASSRAALLVNAVIFLIFLIYNIKINKYFSFAKSMAFVGLFALGLILFLKTTDAGIALKDKMQNNYVNKALTIRMLLIKNGISASQLSPVFGYGPETFSIAQRPFQSVEMNKYQSWEFGWIKAHNHLIQNLVSTGLLGLILSLILFVYTTYKSIKLFFDSSKNENHIYAMSFYLAYLFLFVVNLSSFNYLVTQVYSVLFPVMFFNCLNENKTVLVQVSKKIKVVIAVSVLVMGSVFIFKSYSYWLADVYYQKARAQFEVKNNNIEAEKYNSLALSKNPNEPVYYCQKALIIEKVLNRNKEKISDINRIQILKEIENNLADCIHLGINRDYLVSIAASVYGLMYFDGITNDPSMSLKTYDELIRLTPVSPKPVLQKGIIYLKSGQTALFIQYMHRAIALKNDYVPAYIELIKYYYSQSQIDDVYKLAQNLNLVTFYASEQTEYLNDLVIIAENNQDIRGKNLFLDIHNKYKNFKDTN